MVQYGTSLEITLPPLALYTLLKMFKESNDILPLTLLEHISSSNAHKFNRQ